MNTIRYSYNYSRLPPPHNGHHVHMKPGDECEVLTEGKSDGEPSAWWPATIKLVRGEFFVIDFKIQDETKYSDIVAADKIRTPNRK